MSTPSKRARENKKARKKREKEERRWEKRAEGTHSVPVVDALDLQGPPAPTVEEIMEGLATGGIRAPAPAIPTKLFVGGLSFDTDDRSLRKAFEAHAEVIEAVVVVDRGSGRSRGFGFVTLRSHKDANGVVKALNGAEVDGRRIAVNVATDRR